MTDDRQPIGEIVDGLGVRATLDPDDLVDGAVVLLKVVEPNGDVRLCAAWSNGLSWMERLGMLTAASASDQPAGFIDDHTD